MRFRVESAPVESAPVRGASRRLDALAADRDVHLARLKALADAAEGL